MARAGFGESRRPRHGPSRREDLDALYRLSFGVINDTMNLMGKTIEDLLAEMRNNPAGIRFSDACRVAAHHFGPPRSKGSSHHVWKMPWAGDPRIDLQPGDGGNAKPYQVRQLLQAVDRLTQEKNP
jgi:hypothetical protein